MPVVDGRYSTPAMARAEFDLSGGVDAFTVGEAGVRWAKPGAPDPPKCSICPMSQERAHCDLYDEGECDDD